MEQTEAQKLGIYEKTYLKGVRARIQKAAKLPHVDPSWTPNERVLGRKTKDGNDQRAKQIGPR